MESAKKESIKSLSFQRAFDENTFLTMATHGNLQDHDISFDSNILSIHSLDKVDPPPSSTQIRRIESRDVGQVSQLHRMILPIRYRESFFRRLNSPAHPEYFGFLITSADIRQEIYGFATGKFGPEGTASIYTFGIVPEKQRAGLGTLLLKHCCNELFNSKSCREVRLFVKTNNQPAINFYNKNGFQISRTEKNYYIDKTNLPAMKDSAAEYDAFEMVLFKEKEINLLSRKKRVLIPLREGQEGNYGGLFRRVLDWISRNRCCGGERLNKRPFT